MSKKIYSKWDNIIEHMDVDNTIVNTRKTLTPVPINISAIPITLSLPAGGLYQLLIDSTINNFTHIGIICTFQVLCANNGKSSISDIENSTFYNITGNEGLTFNITSKNIPVAYNNTFMVYYKLII
jgi:hypothetical protein